MLHIDEEKNPVSIQLADEINSLAQRNSIQENARHDTSIPTWAVLLTKSSNEALALCGSKILRKSINYQQGSVRYTRQSRGRLVWSISRSRKCALGSWSCWRFSFWPCTVMHLQQMARACWRDLHDAAQALTKIPPSPTVTSVRFKKPNSVSLSREADAVSAIGRAAMGNPYLFNQ